MKKLLIAALLVISACGITTPSKNEPYGNCTKDVKEHVKKIDDVFREFVPAGTTITQVIDFKLSDGTTDYGVWMVAADEFVAWFNDDGIRCRKVG